MLSSRFLQDPPPPEVDPEAFGRFFNLLDANKDGFVALEDLFRYRAAFSTAHTDAFLNKLFQSSLSRRVLEQQQHQRPGSIRRPVPLLLTSEDIWRCLLCRRRRDPVTKEWHWLEPPQRAGWLSLLTCSQRDPFKTGVAALDSNTHPANKKGAGSPRRNSPVSTSRSVRGKSVYSVRDATLDVDLEWRLQEQDKQQQQQQQQSASPMEEEEGLQTLQQLSARGTTATAAASPIDSALPTSRSLPVAAVSNGPLHTSFADKEGFDALLRSQMDLCPLYSSAASSARVLPPSRPTTAATAAASPREGEEAKSTMQLSSRLRTARNTATTTAIATTDAAGKSGRVSTPSALHPPSSSSSSSRPATSATASSDPSRRLPRQTPLTHSAAELLPGRKELERSSKAAEDTAIALQQKERQVAERLRYRIAPQDAAVMGKKREADSSTDREEEGEKPPFVLNFHRPDNQSLRAATARDQADEVRVPYQERAPTARQQLDREFKELAWKIAMERDPKKLRDLLMTQEMMERPNFVLNFKYSNSPTTVSKSILAESLAREDFASAEALRWAESGFVLRSTPPASFSRSRPDSLPAYSPVSSRKTSLSLSRTLPSAASLPEIPSSPSAEYESEGGTTTGSGPVAVAAATTTAAAVGQPLPSTAEQVAQMLTPEMRRKLRLKQVHKRRLSATERAAIDLEAALSCNEKVAGLVSVRRLTRETLERLSVGTMREYAEKSRERAGSP